MTETLDSLGYEKKLYPLHCQIMGQSRYNKQELFQMLQTVESEIHQLSKFEVLVRQNPSSNNKQKCIDQAIKINSFIENLEQYLTFAFLLKDNNEH